MKIVLGEIAPGTARTAGMRGAALLLMALSSARGQTLRIDRDQWPRLAIAGLLSIACFNLLVAVAQLAGTTSSAAIITFTMPVWVVALAWPVLGERLDGRRHVALAPIELPYRRACC